MLLVTLARVVALAEYLAVLVDFGIEDLQLPDAVGGVLVAVLVLSPEELSAFRAALDNRLQRAVNVCLGPALATIGLTIPAVLTIGLITGARGASRARRWQSAAFLRPMETINTEAQFGRGGNTIPALLWVSLAF